MKIKQKHNEEDEGNINEIKLDFKQNNNFNFIFESSENERRRNGERCGWLLFGSELLESF